MISDMRDCVIFTTKLSLSILQLQAAVCSESRLLIFHLAIFCLPLFLFLGISMNTLYRSIAATTPNSFYSQMSLSCSHLVEDCLLASESPVCLSLPKIFLTEVSFDIDGTFISTSKYVCCPICPLSTLPTISRRHS